jgi:putative chitinase
MIAAATLSALGIDALIWGEPVGRAGEDFYLSTPQREAYWLAQTAHESAGYSRLVENLNYSAAGLLATFRKYFNSASAADYAHHPEAIANRVYANRLGNGDEASGDGWLYRGRGLIQITGKRNYERCGDGLGADLLAEPELLCEPLHAALSAGWFWRTNGCNELADAGAFASVTRRINGGLNGQDDREAWLARVLAAME